MVARLSSMKHSISQSTNNSSTLSLPFVAGIISHPACEVNTSVKQRIPESFIGLWFDFSFFIEPNIHL